jgi:hypothetical protein
MTEAGWNSCTEAYKMLKALRASGQSSGRKLRLFAAACCRGVWSSWQPSRLHPAVLTCEAVADGLVGRKSLRGARSEIGGVGSYSAKAMVYSAMHAALSEVPSAAAEGAACCAADYFGLAAQGDHLTPANTAAFKAARKSEYERQAALLRCIFGTLAFRPLPPVAPAVLAWQGGMVGRLAAAIYEERDFSQERMGVLADAAEEAGLDDAELLAHLRSPGPHARGCWAVDLLLGRE